MTKSLTGNIKLVKLLILFEKELKSFHKCFSSIHFYLEYDIEKIQKEEWIVEPRFYILSENFWHFFVDEKFGIEQILNQYCGLYSFNYKLLKNRPRNKHYPPRLPLKPDTIEMRLNFNFLISKESCENI